jgi:hypothetical protein
LCGLAWSLGWSTVVTRAVGTMPHAIHGTPGQELESWAVRMVRGGQRAVAVRRGPGWSSLWTWSSDQLHTRSSTLAEFKILLGRETS